MLARSMYNFHLSIDFSEILFYAVSSMKCVSGKETIPLERQNNPMLTQPNLTHKVIYLRTYVIYPQLLPIYLMRSVWDPKNTKMLRSGLPFGY